MIKQLLITGLLLFGLTSAFAQDPKEPLQVDPQQEDNLAEITSIQSAKIFCKVSSEDYYTIVVYNTGKIHFVRVETANDRYFKRETKQDIKGVTRQSDVNDLFLTLNKLDFSSLKDKAPEKEPESWFGIACEVSDGTIYAHRTELGKNIIEPEIRAVIKATNELIEKIK